MKIIIKNDNRDIVKNPNVKIIETTEATFTNQNIYVGFKKQLFNTKK